MTIVESNKLIADFLGKDHELNQCIAAPDFHKSWDWLKPAIKKCWEIAKALDISFDKMMEKYRFDYIAYGDLDESYESVVEFIKQHNTECDTCKGRKVLITQREVYHKIATIEIEIPLNVKNDDVADYLNENEELWVNEMDEMLDASDYQGGFGLEGNDMNEKDQDIECRYDIVNENYGGHI